MQNHKRVFPVVVSLVILLATLTGCSSNTDKGIPTATNPVKQSAIPTDALVSTAEPIATEQPKDTPAPTITPHIFEGLNDTQRNSINMLNYLAVLMQRIYDSSGSRVFLDDAYTSIIDNTAPDVVDYTTHEYFTDLFKTLRRFMSVDIKRDRLQYLYEQNQAQAIRQAIPNPLYLLSSTNSRNLFSLASSLVFMAVDSVQSYNAAKDQAELDFLQSTWELDDEERDVVLASREDAFDYLLDISNEYKIPKKYSLNESSVKNYVHYQNESLAPRIQHLEANKDTYQYFAGYWLTLANSYFLNNDYEKCISAIETYMTMDMQIFRKDHDLADTLALGIMSASEIYPDSEYIPIAQRYIELMLDNCETDNWSLRYFAAQVYVDLAGRTKNQDYLEKAYSLALNNVNQLCAEQEAQNKAYLTPIKELHVTPEKGATKQEEQDVKAYNALLDNARKTELPPIYEPLFINIELLFSLTEELQKPDSDRSWIERIIHKNGAPLFLIESLDSKYSFNEVNYSPSDISFDGKKLLIPARYISSDSSVRLIITASDNTTAVLDDWKLTKVDRKTESDLNTFVATYTSTLASQYHFHENDKIEIELYSKVSSDVSPYIFHYKAEYSKPSWPFVGGDIPLVPGQIIFTRND